MVDTAPPPARVLHRERFAIVLLVVGIVFAVIGYTLLTAEIWVGGEFCGRATGGPDWWDGHPCHDRRGGNAGAGMFTLGLSLWALLAAARFRWGKGWLYEPTDAD